MNKVVQAGFYNSWGIVVCGWWYTDLGVDGDAGGETAPDIVAARCTTAHGLSDGVNAVEENARDESGDVWLGGNGTTGHVELDLCRGCGGDVDRALRLVCEGVEFNGRRAHGRWTTTTTGNVGDWGGVVCEVAGRHVGWNGKALAAAGFILIRHCHK